MHEEVPIDLALSKIIDDTSPEELGIDQSKQQDILFPVEDKSKHLVCDMCNCFSSEKKVNLYQHIWRKHHGVSTKEAMARIVAAAESRKVKEEET